MKQLVTLILVFSIFSCDKNDPKPFNEKLTEQEIFNAVVGTWYPSRLARDEEFKQVVCVRDSPCEQKYHVTFNTDSTAYTFSECTNDYTQGFFYIERKQLNGRIENKIKLLQDLIISLSPTASHVGGITLHNYTDSTLIFSGTSYQEGEQNITNLFSEFKRVK